MRGHNTMSLLLIIFSDFVTLKRMHRVFSISFNPSRPLRMLRSRPLKHRLMAFTHTHKHRLSWIAASASSPPDPQTPNLPPKTFPLPIQSGSTTSLLHKEKGGGDFWGKDNWGPHEGSHLNLRHLFLLRPTSAERPPAFSVARSGAASRSPIWAAAAEGHRQSWLSGALALLGGEWCCCHLSWWRRAERCLTPARRPRWGDGTRPRLSSSSSLWEAKPPAGV